MRHELELLRKPYLFRKVQRTRHLAALVVGWFSGGDRPWAGLASGRSWDVLVGLAPSRIALQMGCLLQPGRPWAQSWDGGRSWDVLVGLAPLGGFALGV